MHPCTRSTFFSACTTIDTTLTPCKDPAWLTLPQLGPPWRWHVHDSIRPSRLHRGQLKNGKLPSYKTHPNFWGCFQVLKGASYTRVITVSVLTSGTFCTAIRKRFHSSSWWRRRWDMSDLEWLHARGPQDDLDPTSSHPVHTAQIQNEKCQSKP